MSSEATREFPDSYVNPRGIPRVEFVADIAAYVKQRGIGVDAILRHFQEQHSKFKLMEHKLTQNLSTLQSKVPEITKTIDALDFLESKHSEGESMQTQYGLTDMVFCTAVVPPQPTVHLWLGANVMVEYSIVEAKALLQKNLAAATANMATTVEDLSWLRDQEIIVEVNTSRVYNWDVVRRREEEAAAAKDKK
jgi:prefoldin subunit 5